MTDAWEYIASAYGFAWCMLAVYALSLGSRLREVKKSGAAQ